MSTESKSEPIKPPPVVISDEKKQNKPPNPIRKPWNINDVPHECIICDDYCWKAGQKICNGCLTNRGYSPEP